jgi:hypothetical protein
VVAARVILVGFPACTIFVMPSSPAVCSPGTLERADIGAYYLKGAFQLFWDCQ